jgi:hypothetical protein
MKKLIAIITLLLICSLAMGQNADSKGKLIVNKKITQDTTVVLTVPTNQAWGFSVKWTGGTSVASTVIVRKSMDYGVTYQSYSGFVAEIITGATGNMSFEDYRCVGTNLQLYFDMADGEVGYFTIEYILVRTY